VGGLCCDRSFAVGTGSLDLSRVDEGSCSDSRRRLRVAWRSGLPGTWLPVVHSTCPHNELAALTLRVLAPLPGPTDAPLGELPSRTFRRLRSLAARYGGHKWSHLETAQTYSGAMCRKYLLAAESLRCWPVEKADARLDCFLKAEKVSPLAKFQKPRMIFPRSPRYNLEVASRLKPFEHWLWGRLTGSVLWGGTKTRVVAKGLSPQRRANLILRKFNSFEDCVCFEVDGKAFEAHVSSGQLEREHEVYRSAFPGDKGLARLLREQLSMGGRLPCGARFSRKGGRASGDFNTGMGNTMIMLAIVVGCLGTFGCPFDTLVDGDNALIFLRGSDAGAVLADFAALVLEQSGHEFTLERPVRIVEEIRFGRSAPVYLGPALGWTMVRDWRSVFSGALCSHRWLREPQFAREWLTGVARCELSLAVGVPLLQAWALKILSTTGFSGWVRCHPFQEYFVVGAWMAAAEASAEVSPEARFSFERAFGLSPDDQLRIEGGLVGLNFGEFIQLEPHSIMGCPPGVYETEADAATM